jgi:phage terminase large subunit-like protein
MGLAAELIDARFACPDWVERLREGRSLLPDDLALDWAEADRAVAIFNKLRLPDVEGQPALAIAAGEWQRDIVRAIFGSRDPETKAALIREIFALVPKKNAKTTGGAGIMVTALLMNKRPRAEFVLVGPTQEVADVAFQQASGMIDADEFLRTRYQVQEHIKTIRDRVTGAKLKIKTFDMKVATGAKPAGILLDELHLMSAMSDAARVIGQLRGGMISNPEAFMIIITTQSDKPPAGAFKSELEYARGIRDGRITDNVATLPLLYEFPVAMQVGTDDQRERQTEPWRDPANWHMVLPNLGRSITLERLIGEFKTAVAKGREEVQRWASQHLNIEIGLGLHAGRWRGAEYWERASEPGLTLDALIERSEVAVVGIDGGGLDDLFAVAVIGRERETKRWLAWAHAWAHRSVIEQREEIAARLHDFSDEGDLTWCEDTGIDGDIAGIVGIVERLNDAGLLPERSAVGLDPQGVGVLVDELARIGLHSGAPTYQVVPVGQGYRLSSAVWSCERHLKDRKLVHSGSGLMAWCVGNALAEQRGNAVYITKETAGKAKIDPLVALFDAAKLMELNPEAAGKSVYEDRGLLILG